MKQKALLLHNENQKEKEKEKEKRKNQNTNKEKKYIQFTRSHGEKIEGNLEALERISQYASEATRRQEVEAEGLEDKERLTKKQKKWRKRPKIDSEFGLKQKKSKIKIFF